MPIYEYECTKCGSIEEALQKFSDKPLSTCRHCKGKLTKLVSQSAFHLKGSGWYVTDYADKPKKTGDSTPQNKPAKSAESKNSNGGSTASKTDSD